MLFLIADWASNVNFAYLYLLCHLVSRKKYLFFWEKKNINMELNMITVFFFLLFNVMHLRIMFWHCIINHNKMKFRAQSEKLFCLISLLPFTRSVNMTEPLSCIWVCVCWTRAVIWYLNRLLWGACPLTVWGHSQTKLNTHSPCTNISVSTAACSSLHFCMHICIHNVF